MYERENDFVCVCVCVCVFYSFRTLIFFILPNIDPVMEQNKMFFTESQRSIVI